MADSKRERREAAREARRIAQEEAAAAAAKARVRSIGITILSLVVIGTLVWLAIDNVRGTSIEASILIDREAVEPARAAAGCEVLAEDAPNPGAAEHFDPATAPPADVMYPFDIRPAHSGPHFGQTLPIIRAGVDSQLEERGLLHNLEHGSVAIFYDPEQVEGGEVGAMESLSETLNDNGFALARSGSGIFVSPFTDPGISSGKAVALRAWGQAVDCDRFDETVAQAFIRDHYGREGIAPEGGFAPYPFDTLAYADEAGDGSDGANTGGTNSDVDGDGETDDGSMTPGEDASDETSDDTTDGDTTDEGATTEDDATTDDETADDGS